MPAELKLKPCPWCGAPAERRIGDTGPANAYRKWVECTACPCRTSVHLTEDADDRPADEEWNALPRALVWTTEPPADSGWYWFRDKGGEPRILGIGLDLTQFDTLPAQWAGPIPAPQEPRHD